MTTFDIILLIVAVVVVAQQLTLLIRAKREIIIRGTAPSRGAVVVLLVLVLALAIIRNPNLRQTWPIFVLIAIACLAIFAGGCGLSARGMFSSGRYVAFAQAVYYEVKEFKGQTIFRLSRSTRETQMVVPEGKLDAILELMEQNSIPTYEAYTKKMAKRAGDRLQAQQRKKKKKK